MKAMSVLLTLAFTVQVSCRILHHRAKHISLVQEAKHMKMGKVQCCRPGPCFTPMSAPVEKTMCVCYRMAADSLAHSTCHTRHSLVAQPNGKHRNRNFGKIKFRVGMLTHFQNQHSEFGMKELQI